MQVARFVAALLVVVTHTTYYAQERAGSPIGVWHFGEIGVPIFFVISGLVMVLSTAKMPSDSGGARTFLLRRFVRIVPLYWLATAAKVAVALLAPAVVNHNHFQVDHAIKSFLFIPYFNGAGELRPMHGVGWTLLHEVYFYLLFAASLAAGRRPILWVSGVILAGWLVGVTIQDKSAFVTVATSQINLHFVLGMAAGWVLLNRRAASAVILYGAAGLLACGLVVGSNAAVITAFAVSVLALSRHQLSTAWQPVVALGDSSYSLYLFHPFIAPALVVLIGRRLELAPGLTIGLTCFVTVLISHLLHLIIERPVVRRVRESLRARGLA